MIKKKKGGIKQVSKRGEQSGQVGRSFIVQNLRRLLKEDQRGNWGSQKGGPGPTIKKRKSWRGNGRVVNETVTGLSLLFFHDRTGGEKRLGG